MHIPQFASTSKERYTLASVIRSLMSLVSTYYFYLSLDTLLALVQ